MSDISQASELQIFDTEDGETWWVAGHVDDRTAIRELHRQFDKYTDLAEYSDEDMCVSRGWWRDAHDPSNDELWLKCDETDEGAMPFTRIEL